MTREIGYADALAELEAILEEIEDDAVDVDVLAAKVKRGAELLRICRGRITAAKVEVTQIVAELDPDAAADGLAPHTTRRAAGAYVRWPDALRLQDLTAEHHVVRDARRVAGRRSDRPVRVRAGRSITSSRSSRIAPDRAWRAGSRSPRSRRRPTRLRLGVLVTGNPYRHPSVLANMAATLDVVSNGRLELGIGAGWNQDESDALGIDLPPLKERFDRFDEALEVITRLLSDEVSRLRGHALPAARGAL